MFYVNISILFGRLNIVILYIRYDDYKIYYGIGVMGVVLDEMFYYVNVERDYDERETSLNGSISFNFYYI